MTGARTMLFAAAISAAAGGCTKQILDDLDKIENEAWVDVSEKPAGELDSVEYGLGVAFAGGTEEGVAFFVLGQSPTGFSRVEYTRDGKRTITGTVLEDVEEAPLDEPIPIAGDPGAQTVALGYLSGSQSRIALVDAVTGEIASDFPLGSGADFPAGVVFGETGASAGTDLAAVAGNELFLVADYLSDPRAPESCSFSSAPAAVLTEELDGAGSEELLAAGQDEVFLLTAVDVTDNDACPETASLPSQGVRTMAAGDFNGNGTPDLAFGRPGAGVVDLYLDVDLSANPLPESMSLAGPSGSQRFGEALAVGDFDLDGFDDLAVGDPDAAAEGKAGAGVVSIYRGGDSLSVEPDVPLHDADPGKEQGYGRTLGVAQFGGMAPLLLVATAESEVFTYFRLPIEGSVDPRAGR